MPSLADFGIDTSEQKLPFFKPDRRGRWQILRIVKPLDPPTNSKVKVLARFLIEEPTGLQKIWDVASQRCLAGLGTLTDVTKPFELKVAGKNYDTTYEIRPLEHDADDQGDDVVDDQDADGEARPSVTPGVCALCGEDAEGGTICASCAKSQSTAGSGSGDASSAETSPSTSPSDDSPSDSSGSASPTSNEATPSTGKRTSGSSRTRKSAGKSAKPTSTNATLGG